MKEYLINEDITVSELICINKDKENLGTMSTKKALSLAEEQELDLVLISNNPAIAKIIDYKKLVYEESKKDKKQKVIPNKEIDFSLNIDSHDLLIKVNKIKLFLEKKHNVLIKIKFKGRELNHPEAGENIVKQILSNLEGLYIADKPAEMKGRNMVIFLKHK